MKIMKRISAFFVASLMLLSFAACNNSANPEGETTQSETETTTSYIREEKTRIAALNGTVGLGIAKMKVSRNYAYEVAYYDSAEEISQLISNGEADLATLPINVACELYQSTGGKIKVLAVNGLGVLSVMVNGEALADINSLNGKTVYATGEGTAAQYIIEHIFTSGGVDANIKYIDDATELYELAISGDAKICILPEPLASMAAINNTDLKYALSLSDEWNKINATPLAQSVVVIRNEYAEQHPDYVDKFLGHNETSLNYLNNNLGAGAEVFLVNGGYFEDEALAGSVTAHANLSFMEGEEMKNALSKVIAVLYEANPDTVGGKIPADDIFCIG